MQQTIILIRHAEKPGGNWPGPGFTEDGIEDPESLVIRGWQRAGALTSLFSGPPSDINRPNRIYASGVVKQDGTGSRSKRPLQTIVPLAQKLSITPVDKFSKGQEAELASELIALDGVTLVCWQHETLPDIVREITGSGDLRIWPDTRFDVIWILERSSGVESWSFSQKAQQLLAGDSPLPL
jgi:broad specificity phosphatase PhoE